MKDSRFTIAVVGDFQRGKSTLVNALLGLDSATMGQGLSTTHENTAYALSSDVSIIDTPGFDANNEDDGTAAAAVDMANIIMYVHESKALGDSGTSVFKQVREQGKRIVFILNCLNFAKWSPNENADIVATIEAELDAKGFLPSVLPVAGQIVLPINVLWARFGLGMVIDPLDEKRIRLYANDDLGLQVAEMSADCLFAEMLSRSGFPSIRDFLNNLPSELLKIAVENPQREIDRIVDRFAIELKKRQNAA